MRCSASFSRGRTAAACGKLTGMPNESSHRPSAPSTSPERRHWALPLAEPKTYRRISIGLFAISLFCDGFYVDGPSPRAWSLGFGELIAGWFAAADGIKAWWANPLLLVAWLTFRSKSPLVSSLCTVLALWAMLSFLSVHIVPVSEATTYRHVVRYGIGYWIWIASGLALLAGNAIRVMRRTNEPVNRAAGA